ncbi:phosphatase inhibitor-domain-containing protein [Lactarius akahatsu]|uniref:Type 1 phosphatases regulator n=1 Tax=Lactarius akahatsu TaxID=416441 RepID=A0AAD4LSI6_9AGAM|nr:phosphatase inhibitor-domain-containing protein [Lactarius akahatsu]
MSFAPQSGPPSSMPREGSRVAVAVQGTEQVDTLAQTDLAAGPAPAGTLHLRGGPHNRPHVVWGEDVVDNEGLGRKKSKICCIYHRPRRFDESSDEDSSGTESESDDGNARPSRDYCHHQRHAHNGECEADHPRDPDNKLRGGSGDRNAYEQMPPHKGKGKASS